MHLDKRNGNIKTDIEPIITGTGLKQKLYGIEKKIGQIFNGNSVLGLAAELFIKVSDSNWLSYYNFIAHIDTEHFAIALVISSGRNNNRTSTGSTLEENMGVPKSTENLKD